MRFHLFLRVLILRTQIFSSLTFPTSSFCSITHGQFLSATLSKQRKLGSIGAHPALNTVHNSSRICWIEPLSKEALTASLECGQHTFAFSNESSLSEWRSLGRFQALVVQPNGRISDENTKDDFGRWIQLNSSRAQNEALTLAGQESLVVLDAADWKIIPAENMIAAYQTSQTKLLAVVSSVTEAKVLHLVALFAGSK